VEKPTATSSHPHPIPGTEGVKPASANCTEVMSDTKAEATGKKGVTLTLWYQEIKKSTFIYFLFLNRILYARASWKAHYRPVIDP
jgi:hypothetical protein